MHWWDVRRGVPDAASAHKMSDDEPSAAVAADETRRSGKSAREAAKKRKKDLVASRGTTTRRIFTQCNTCIRQPSLMWIFVVWYARRCRQTRARTRTPVQSRLTPRTVRDRLAPMRWARQAHNVSGAVLQNGAVSHNDAGRLGPGSVDTQWRASERSDPGLDHPDRHGHAAAGGPKRGVGTFYDSPRARARARPCSLAT